MTKRDMGVVLIIPTLNEIKGMQEIMPKIKKEWYDELIVADGGSTGGTIEYCKEHNFPYFIQSGVGLSNAEDEAFLRTTKDIIILFTPDGNSIPELIPALTEKIKEGYYMVIAFRYYEGAKSDDDDIVTAFGNKFFTGLVNVLFRAKYTDSLVGLRAYTRDAMLRMHLIRQSEENFLRRNTGI